MRALRYPRWEDFNYESLDETKNRLYWLGNGMTDAENMLVGDRKLIYTLGTPTRLPTLCYRGVVSSSRLR